MQVKHEIATFPTTLQPLVLQHWQRFNDNATPTVLELLDKKPELLQQLLRAFAASDFVANFFIKDGDKLFDFADARKVNRKNPTKRYYETAAALVEKSQTEQQLKDDIRKMRNYELARIAWRAINLQAAVADIMEELSSLADAIIDNAKRALINNLAVTFGMPTLNSKEIELNIIAVGKLGGGELNFSSDVDLIFTYSTDGETAGGRFKISNQEFFTKVCQQLITFLSDITAVGMAYRVDMRLRPFGNSGPLVMSFAALESYYQQHGRQWERYALIKSRLVGKNSNKNLQNLKDIINPFVYRRYVDYGVFDSLREMKVLVENEVKRQQLQHDVKRGPGGIRQIEFIAQSFQLIHGGKFMALQQQSLIKVLQALVEIKFLQPKELEQLLAAYLFLRELENALQFINDEQRHNLPQNDTEWQRVAIAMQMEVAALKQQLQQHQQQVQRLFAKISAVPEVEQNTEKQDLTKWLLLWQGKLSEEEAQALLPFNADETKQIYNHIKTVYNELLRRVQQRANQRLEKLMPIMLQKLADNNDVTVFAKILSLITKIATRSAYLALLYENQAMLQRLITYCGLSPWIIEKLTNYPLLLDEIITNYKFDYKGMQKNFNKELGSKLDFIKPEESELVIEALRHFKLTNSFKIAVAEISNDISASEANAALSHMAQAILTRILQMSHSYLQHKYCERQFSINDCGFLVIGCGSLAVNELNYESDLDLIFLYDNDIATEFKHALTKQQYFLKLAQKIIHFLQVQTLTGVLYKTDTRLRPSGNAGLMVSEIQSFENYQQQQAWTWEHQALVRMRPIIGDIKLSNRFINIRQQVITQKREVNELWQDIQQMRQKVITADKNELNSQAIKFNQGGLFDIEFIIQGLVLQHANKWPQLASSVATIEILESLHKFEVISNETKATLIESYNFYHQALHQLQLRQQLADSIQQQLWQCQQKIKSLSLYTQLTSKCEIYGAGIFVIKPKQNRV